MSILQIKKSVKTLGSAQEFLRSVILMMNKGLKSGPGWRVGPGELQGEEREPAKKIEGLEEHARALHALLMDEDLTEDKLREAAEGLLPALADTLSGAGYGVIEGPDASKQEKKPGDVSTGGTGGNQAPGGADELKDPKKGHKFPWEKR